jgi:RES domain-containing protein
MAFAWRLADPRFAGDLEGSGNRIHGARWNSPGRGVLYCSQNLSLCVLEALVHLNPIMRGRLPPRLALRIADPDSAATMAIATLPGGDRARKRRMIGDRRLDRGEALILVAPSVVVPAEMNPMFNPSHPRMREVRIVERQKFVFDDRLRPRQQVP